MARQKRLFGILIASSLLIFTTGNESLNNKCDFSQGHKILTCVNLNPQTSDLGNLIKANTHLLIIKGSSNLEIPANYHKNKNLQHIRSYQLVNNGVIEISSFAFSDLGNLQYLKISNNQHWSVLQGNTFSGLHGLETLNIVNNSIGQLENDAFEGLSSLNILEMMYNKVTVVPSLIFKPLQSLRALFLYRNNIQILENGCFEGLTEIQHLDITHNKLKEIKTSTFNGLSKLTYLYVSFNEIGAIEGEFILPNLKFLYLPHNKLKSISNYVFKSLDSLQAIDLSYNEISFISDNAFNNLRYLDHVYLGHNNATSFRNLKFNELNAPLVIV